MKGLTKLTSLPPKSECTLLGVLHCRSESCYTKYELQARHTDALAASTFLGLSW